MITTAETGRTAEPAVVDLDPVQVLDAAGDCAFARTRAEADLLEIAARWADLNPVTDHTVAADWWDGQGIPVPESIPEIAAPAVAEFAARIGQSTGAGKGLIFDALQLRHRMPCTWSLVLECRMPAFRARQLVMACCRLNDAAVGWLDRQMVTVTGRVGPAQLERMVARAATELDPEFIVDQRRKRYVHVQHNDPNSGIDSSGVHACLDPMDALDLDAALNAGAEARKAWGSAQDRDGRRAEALGDLARLRLGQQVLPLAPDDQQGEDLGSTVPPLVNRPRELTMYVHLSDLAIQGADDPHRVWLGECGTTGQVVTAELIRQWCGNPDLDVKVKQVIDLREPIVTDTYRPNARQREHVALNDGRCGFAHCTRPIHPVPTRRKPDGALEDSWDADHIRAWQPGDTTSTDGLVGLCRHHHRDKTLYGWRYRRIATGMIIWRSPYGYDYLRTPTGTTDLGRHRPSAPAVPGWLHSGPLRPPHDHDEEPPPDPADDDIRSECDGDVPHDGYGGAQDSLLDDTG